VDARGRSLALEFVVGARWSEIHIGEKLWTIPPERMKAGNEHRLPLSTRAVAMLEEMKPLRCGMLAGTRKAHSSFPRTKRGQSLSNMALLMLLRRLKRDDLTARRFRRQPSATSHPAVGKASQWAVALRRHVIGSMSAHRSHSARKGKSLRFLGRALQDHASSSWLSVMARGRVPCFTATLVMPRTLRSLSSLTRIGPGVGAVPGTGCAKAVE
jgi:integrase